MNRHFSPLSTGTLLVALYAVPALAHDPQQHQAQPTQPDCSAMTEMDKSPMNTNDPVMKAMQQKCGAMLGQEKHDEAAGKQDSGHRSSSHADDHQGAH